MGQDDSIDSRGIERLGEANEAEDRADRREEWERFYERVHVAATADQIKYVLILLRLGWLEKTDFRSSVEFYRKKKHLSHSRADELIKLGKQRMAGARIQAQQVPRWMTE